jgi:hypothetical protein
VGWALVQKKDYAAAKLKLEEAAQLSGNGDLVNQHLGELALAQKSPDQAREYFLSALTIAGGPAPLRQRITAAVAALQPAGRRATASTPGWRPSWRAAATSVAPPR